MLLTRLENVVMPTTIISISASHIGSTSTRTEVFEIERNMTALPFAKQDGDKYAKKLNRNMRCFCFLCLYTRCKASFISLSSPSSCVAQKEVTSVIT